MATEQYSRIALTFGYLLITSVLVSACQTFDMAKPEIYIDRYQDYSPTVSQFQVCHNVDCENKTSVTLDDNDWLRLSDVFHPLAKSAHEERQQVGVAIALFENIIAPLAKKIDDQPRNDIGKWGARQLDCVAETVNTTTYLLLFQQKGWLRWHQTRFPRHRGLLSLLAPHYTAVLQEKANGREFAIDSWFHANGKKPEVVSVQRWLEGYDPADPQEFKNVTGDTK